MRRMLTVLLCAVACLSCGSTPEPPAPPEEQPLEAAPAGEPADAFLPPPFTPEQIRDEWIAGFSIDLERKSADSAAVERWTVVAADAEGPEIEYASLDEHGHVTGEPRRERATWSQLRDHAMFPAEDNTREDVTRDTPLGTLDGWLYRIQEEGVVTEYFFARELPGAPVHLLMTREGDVVMELTQLARSRPE